MANNPQPKISGVVSHRHPWPPVILGTRDGVRYQLAATALEHGSIAELRDGTRVQFEPGGGLTPTAKRLTIDS